MGMGMERNLRLRWARLLVAPTRKPPMPLAQLLNPDQLAARLQDAKLLLLDCRFALDDPAQGRRSYQQGHIPGARFADLERDLSGPVIAGQTGRHPLPEPSVLLERLRSLGVNN